MFPISCNAFGDIATMITIAYTIAQALDDARGSADEYRAFAYLLRAFGELLEEIKELHASASDDGVSSRVLSGVKGCCEVLEEARMKVARYGTLDDVRGSNSLRRGVLKLRWRLLKREEVGRLHAKLLSRMDILLGLIDRKEFANVKSQLSELSARGGTLQAAVDVLKANLHLVVEASSTMMRGTTALSNTLHTEMAALRTDVNVLSTAYGELAHTARDVYGRHQLGAESGRQNTALAAAAAFAGGLAFHADFRLPLFYAISILLLHTVYTMNCPLPPSVDIRSSNCILLIDLLGARISLPMELCGTSDDFHQTLLRLFEGKRGQVLVGLHAYEIMTAGDHLPISTERWLEAVQPGCEVEMGAIIRRRESTVMGVGSSMRAAICPRCKASLGRNVTRSPAFALCRSCQGQISVEEALYNNQSPHSYVKDDGEDERDMPFLRMIRVVYMKVPIPPGEKTNLKQCNPDAKHKCPVPGCESTFKRLFDFKGHMSSHSGYEPFKYNCPGCNRILVRWYAPFRATGGAPTIPARAPCEACKGLSQALMWMRRHDGFPESTKLRKRKKKDGRASSAGALS